MLAIADHLMKIIEKKYSFALLEGPTRRLDGTAITAEAKYHNNITRSRNNFCLGLNYKGSNKFFHADGVKLYQSETNDSEIKLFHYV